MDVVPPDPFKTLGVARNASSGEIKSAYRKGCLRCHPDKTSDPDKIAEFHRIQVAFDILGDDDKRQKYDEAVKLQQLRRDVFARRNDPSRRSAPDVRSTYPPPGDVYYSSTRGPMRFEERRPKTSTWPRDSDRDEEFSSGESRPQNRKFQDKTDATPRRSSAPSNKASPSTAAKTASKISSEQRERESRQKQRDRMKKTERTKRFPQPDRDDVSEDDTYYETAQKLRQKKEDERKKQSSRSDEERPSRKASVDTRQYSDSRAGPPPSSYRQEAFSSENVGLSRKDSKSGRPAAVRRSSTSSKARDVSPPPSSSRRGSSRREIVDPPPSLFSSKSNPADIKVPSSSSARRAQTSDDYDERPKPTFQRSETMPVRSSGSSSRRPASGRKVEPLNTRDLPNLRHPDFAEFGINTSSPSPIDRHPSPKSKPRWSDPEDSDGDRYRAELREPSARLRRTVSPVSRRPPTSYKNSSPQPSRRPSLSRSSGSYDRRVPELRRGQTLPTPPFAPQMRTGFSNSSTEGLLPFEIPTSTSPVEMVRPDGPPSYGRVPSGVRRVPREAAENYARRPSYSLGGEPTYASRKEWDTHNFAQNYIYKTRNETQVN